MAYVGVYFPPDRGCRQRTLHVILDLLMGVQNRIAEDGHAICPICDATILDADPPARMDLFLIHADCLSRMLHHSKQTAAKVVPA